VKKLKLLVSAAVAVAMLAIPGTALAKSRDGDHDKMPDKWERAHHLSTKKKNAKADPDKDGLSNIGEFRSRTNPRDADTDNDGTEDGDEDRDRDNVDNGNETREGTNPCDRDSDNDGVRDGREDRDGDHLNNRGEDDTANDPIDRDTDDDGIEDGNEQGGTITSFNAQTKELTITTTTNQVVTGVVTDSTEIKCKTEDENEDGEHHGRDDGKVSASRDGSDDEGGDDHGDDNSGPGSRHEHDGDEDNQCSTADLTPGTPVHEAELNVTADPDQWEEIELLK
jgi:hypothetical protein